MVKGMDDLKP